MYKKNNPTKNTVTYTITMPDDGWCSEFDEEYANLLRPIAETLAMLDGNAFFTFENHWRVYLSEADALIKSNGGLDGWAGKASWISQQRAIDEDHTLRDCFDKLQVLLALKRNKNENI